MIPGNKRIAGGDYRESMCRNIVICRNSVIFGATIKAS